MEGVQYYHLLGIDPNAKEAEIKEAYRRACLKYHPDRNKSRDAAEKFKRCTMAYNILSNPDKRQLYDSYGESAFKKDGDTSEEDDGEDSDFSSDDGHRKYQQRRQQDIDSFFDPMRLFNSFANDQNFFSSFSSMSDFIGSAKGNPSYRTTSTRSRKGIKSRTRGSILRHSAQSCPRQKTKRGSNLLHPIILTLEEMYTGTTKQISYKRSIVCRHCKGKCYNPRARPLRCSTCNGLGRRVTVYRTASTVMRSETTCPTCHGNPLHYRARDICVACNGRATQIQGKLLNICVPRGAMHDESIVLQKEGDETGSVIPGDIIITFKQKPHCMFRREGIHLYIRRKITLYEALIGYCFVLKGVDQSILLVRSRPNQITQPGAKCEISGQGMPHRNNPKQRGSILIHFEVEFPDPRQLHIPSLKQGLPKPPPMRDLNMKHTGVRRVYTNPIHEHNSQTRDYQPS